MNDSQILSELEQWLKQKSKDCVESHSWSVGFYAEVISKITELRTRTQKPTGIKIDVNLITGKATHELVYPDSGEPNHSKRYL